MSNYKMTITATIAVIAIAAIAAATIGVVHAQVASHALDSTGNEVEISVDSMNQITTQIVSNLVDKAIEPEVKMENIEQAKHLIFGKPVILQTNNVPETIDISDEYDTMTDGIRTALFACAAVTCNDPTVKAAAQELADRTTYWLEIKNTLEVQTTRPNCSAELPQTCEVLNQADEPSIVNFAPTVGTDKIWDGWHREIRSPYYPVVTHPNGFTPQENIIVLDEPIANGECSVVVKEIQGIKSILRPAKIPIWQEPWSSGAQIIGDSTVWVIDFVPAEFVKNLNYCNVNGEIVFDYDTNVIIERELLHFWNYLPRGNQ